MTFPMIEVFASIIGGAVTSGVPLIIMLRKANMDLAKEKMSIDVANKINLEAEWKRLLDLRTDEITRLNKRDDEQQKEISSLQSQHAECQKSDARNSERIKMNEERIKWLEETIIGLKADLLAQRRRKKEDAPVPNESRTRSDPATDVPGIREGP